LLLGRMTTTGTMVITGLSRASWKGKDIASRPSELREGGECQ
jgi:hypothetical protein